jgi:anaerobic selenocysteine-containing dehydrogenase
VVDWTFGTEELACYSDIVHAVEVPPHVCMHRADAEKLGLLEEKQIRIQLDGESLIIDLKASEKMAPGTLVIPAHRQLDRQMLGLLPMSLPAEALGKVDII